MDTEVTDRPSAPRRQSSWPARLTVLAIALGVAFAAGEIFIRTAFWSQVDTEQLRKTAARSVHMEGLCRSSNDAGMRYELVPGRYQEWGTQIAATHPRESVRISTMYYPPADPSFRIALIGDSTSFGHGVFHECAYASVLRSELEQTYSMPIELRNYSLPAYNSTQERAIFESRVAAWKPDLLLLHYDHNDCAHNSYSMIPPEFGDNALQSALLKFTRRRLRHLRWNIEGMLYKYRSKIGRETTGKHISGGAVYDDHLEELRRIGEGAQRMGLPAVVFIFDWSLTPHENPQGDPHYTELHVPLVRHLEAAGFSVLDMYSDYQEVMRENRWEDLLPLSIDETDRKHPNERGHAFIARHFHDFIVNDPPLHLLLEQASRNAAEKPSPQEYLILNHFRTGVQFNREQRYEEAEQHLRIVAAHMPDHLEVKLVLAWILKGLKQHEEALALFTEVLARKDDLPAAHLASGEILSAEKQFAEAITNHFQFVVNSDTTQILKERAALKMASSASHLAKDLAEQGDPAQAAALIREIAAFLEKGGQTKPILKLEQIAEMYSSTPPPASPPVDATPPGNR